MAERMGRNWQHLFTNQYEKSQQLGKEGGMHRCEQVTTHGLRARPCPTQVTPPRGCCAETSLKWGDGSVGQGAVHALTFWLFLGTNPKQ